MAVDDFDVTLLDRKSEGYGKLAENFECGF
jgi:hypothetical protein